MDLDPRLAAAVLAQQSPQQNGLNFQRHWEYLHRLGQNYSPPGPDAEGSENLIDRREGERDEEMQRRQGAAEYKYQHAMDAAMAANMANSGGPLSRAAGYNDIGSNEAMARYAAEAKAIQDEKSRRLNAFVYANPEFATIWGGSEGGKAGSLRNRDYIAEILKTMKRVK